MNETAEAIAEGPCPFETSCGCTSGEDADANECGCWHHNLEEMQRQIEGRDDPRMLRQEAPWPHPLFDLVEKTTLDPGWSVYLQDRDRGQGSRGLTLCILTETFDSYHPEKGRNYRVMHFFPVPPASFDRRSWQRWLFDRYLDVLIHEGCELFVVAGVRPFAPHHGDGEDPYTIFERVPDDVAPKLRPGSKA